MKRVSAVVLILTLLIGLCACSFGGQTRGDDASVQSQEASDSQSADASSDAAEPLPSDTAMTVGKHSITLSEFSYMYQMHYRDLAGRAQQSEQTYGYNMYGFDYNTPVDEQDSPYTDDNGNPIKWDVQLQTETVNYLHEFYTLYDLAVSEGYTITADEEADIRQQIETMRRDLVPDADEKTDPDEAVNTVMQKYYGVTMAFLQEVMEKEAIVQRLADDRYKRFSDKYSDEMIDQVYQADRADYDVADLRFVQSGGSEWESTSSKSEVSSSVSEAAAAWAFEDARKKGDAKQFKNADGQNIELTVLKPAYPQQVVDVRHILCATMDLQTLQPLSDEEVAAKRKQAEKILSEWNSLKVKNAEAFGKLADKYSEDTNKNGGLYTSVKPGDMVKPFNDWIFDDKRREGDVEIIETEYGYHVMYYDGNKDYAYRSQIRDARVQDDYSDWIDRELKKTEKSMRENTSVLDSARERALQRIAST